MKRLAGRVGHIYILGERHGVKDKAEGKSQEQQQVG